MSAYRGREAQAWSKANEGWNRDGLSGSRGAGAVNARGGTDVEPDCGVHEALHFSRQLLLKIKIRWCF